MFKGKSYLTKNLAYLILMSLHSFFFVYFLYESRFSGTLVFNLISSISLIGMAFYSFLNNKAYFYYFYISIVISSIPIVFKIYIAAILIIPELIVLFMLMYRGLTKEESNIKIYEAGLANIPTNLTSLDVIPRNLVKFKGDAKKMSIIPIKNDNINLKQRNYNIIMVVISIVLTIIFLIGSITSL